MGKRLLTLKVATRSNEKPPEPVDRPHYMLIASLLLPLVALGQWPEKEYAFKSVEFGSGMQQKVDKGIWVIRTEAEYRAYMRKRGDADRPLPKINWRINQVIAIHVGTAPTPGYGVKVNKLLKTSTGADAEVEITRPDPGMVTAQVISYPWAVIRSERFSGKVELKVME